MGKLPIPAGLKRYLVPVWNEAHRVGWLRAITPARASPGAGSIAPSAAGSGRCSIAGE